MRSIKDFYNWYRNELNELDQKIVDEWADGGSIPEINTKYPGNERRIDELVGYYEDHFAY